MAGWLKSLTQAEADDSCRKGRAPDSRTGYLPKRIASLRVYFDLPRLSLFPVKGSFCKLGKLALHQQAYSVLNRPMCRACVVRRLVLVHVCQVRCKLANESPAFHRFLR